MNNQIQVYCENTATMLAAHGGETLLELAARMEPPLPFRPICAHVNNKNESLGFALYAPKTVEYLPATSESGERTYIRSLCMMLYKAVDSCFPGTTLLIEHSICGGYYCRLPEVEVTQQTVATLEEYMKGLRDSDLPIEEMMERTERVEQLYDSQGLHDKVRLMRTRHKLYTTYCRLDGIADSYYGAMAPSTGFITSFALHRYKEGFLLMGFDHNDPSRTANCFL